MSTQKRKNQTGEPTTNGGQFAKATERAESSTVLTPATPTTDDILWGDFTRPGPDRTPYITADGKIGIVLNANADEHFRRNPGSRRAVLSAGYATDAEQSWPKPGYTEIIFGWGEHGSVPDKDVEAFLRDFEGSRLPGPLPLPNPPIEGNVIVDLEGGHQASVDASDADSFRGLTKSGNQVIAMSTSADGAETLLTLSICCNAAAGANEYGLECKRCYEEVPFDLEADPIIAYARV